MIVNLYVYCGWEELSPKDRVFRKHKTSTNYILKHISLITLTLVEIPHENLFTKILIVKKQSQKRTNMQKFITRFQQVGIS